MTFAGVTRSSSRSTEKRRDRFRDGGRPDTWFSTLFSQRFAARVTSRLLQRASWGWARVVNELTNGSIEKPVPRGAGWTEWWSGIGCRSRPDGDGEERGEWGSWPATARRDQRCGCRPVRGLIASTPPQTLA